MALASEFMELTGKIDPSPFPIFFSFLRNRTSPLTSALGPGLWQNIVDFIEPLQWFPTRTRSRGRRLHDGFIEVYGAMIMRVKARMDAGEDVPDCLVKTLLETREQEKLDWEDLCMLSVVFNLGGTSVGPDHTVSFHEKAS